MSDVPAFNLCEHATDFVTREIGKLLRLRLLEFDAHVENGLRINIDATGVSIITPSFADEFFGRTVARLGVARFKERFSICGVDDSTKALINGVVRNRLLLDRTNSQVE